MLGGVQQLPNIFAIDIPAVIYLTIQATPDLFEFRLMIQTCVTATLLRSSNLRCSAAASLMRCRLGCVCTALDQS